MGKEIEIIMPNEVGDNPFDGVYVRNPRDLHSIALALSEWFGDNCPSYEMDVEDFESIAEDLLESGEAEFGDGEFAFRMPID